MSNVGQQLALALYQDYSLRDEGVEKAPPELGFKRSNAFIQIVDLNLAGRRLIDVAYFIASEDAELHNEYRVDLGLFRWLLGTTSRNKQHLEKLIRDAQRAAIELNEIDSEDPSKDRYGRVPLLGPAFIGDGYFTFDLSQGLQRVIKNPKTFHFLSLKYVFKSVHSKVLYDRLQPYIDAGATPWFEIRELRAWTKCETKTYDLFKHFRNKVLEVAVAEIREVTGLNVDILTQSLPGTKKVGQIRFRITQPPGPKNEQKLEFIVLRSMYETLRQEFALNQNEFNEIITNRETFTDDRIQQAIDYTRHNAKLGKVKIRAGGYFMKALREGYLLGNLDRQIHQRIGDETNAKDAVEREAAARAAQAHAESLERDRMLANLGWEAYVQLPPEQQADMLTQFCQSVEARPLARSIEADTEVNPADLGDYLEDPRVRSTFGAFVAARVRSKASKAARQAAAAK